MKTETIEVTFPGGKKVDAKVGDFLIHTDQPRESGGDGSAPAPFALFLASIATCAGIFALGFCQARHIDTTGLGISAVCSFDPVAKHYDRIDFHVTLPHDFPEKYHESIINAIELCTVKRHIRQAPHFHVSIQS